MGIAIQSTERPGRFVISCFRSPPPPATAPSPSPITDDEALFKVVATQSSALCEALAAADDADAEMDEALCDASEAAREADE